ncbi:hypothetical protein AB1Y20_015620 [Prymnesium parvum]|uniref:Uncharacterized protein n=1 Tax=Prymnesium parvum TaxID=97485 RepID=A0AB34K3I4_PRYPA
MHAAASAMLLLLLDSSASALRVPTARPHPRASTLMQFGNPFENMKNPFADKMDGATTIALTLSFRCDKRGPSSVLGQLDKLASEADTSTLEGFSELCTDAALLLLRRSGEWLGCCGSAQHCGTDDQALAVFDKLAIREAAKFEDRDTGASVDAALAAAGLQGGTGKPTVAVVCILACVIGDREDSVPKSFSGDASKMRAGLEELAAAGNADQEVLALELFWVPGSDNEVLEPEEVTMDWPELMSC